LSQSDDGKDLYWVYEDNNWSSPFTTAEFLEKRIPERGVCFLVCFKPLFKTCLYHLLDGRWIKPVCLLLIFLSQARPLHWDQTLSSLYDPLVHDACGAPWVAVCVQWQCHDSSIYYPIFSVGRSATPPKQPCTSIFFRRKWQNVCPTHFSTKELAPEIRLVWR